MRPRPSRRRGHVLAVLALAAPLAAPTACEPPPAGGPAPPADRKEEPTMAFTLTSPAFQHGNRVPVPYTGEGSDVSPPLAWSAPPEGTKTFALVCEDPDAPSGTWVHWVLWNLPGTLRSLPENVAKTETVPALRGARQGRNSWPKTGYNGPLPPKGHGVHHYHFTLYALDAELDLKAGSDKKALTAALEGHILGRATLMGTYTR